LGHHRYIHPPACAWFGIVELLWGWHPLVFSELCGGLPTADLLVDLFDSGVRVVVEPLDLVVDASPKPLQLLTGLRFHIHTCSRRGRRPRRRGRGSGTRLLPLDRNRWQATTGRNSYGQHGYCKAATARHTTVIRFHASST